MTSIRGLAETGGTRRITHRRGLSIAAPWHGNAYVGIQISLVRQHRRRLLPSLPREPIPLSILSRLLMRAAWPAGGYIFVPDRSPSTEAVFAVWRAESDPAVVRVEAISPAPDDSLSFDLLTLGVPVLVLRAPGAEHLLIGDEACQIRLDVTAGTVLDGPVQFRYDLAGAVGLEAKLLTLQRLVALLRLGRFPRRLVEHDRHARRTMMALRALDARRAGATHREIAIALFGEAIVAADWSGRSAYLRCRIQRLIRLGEALALGGYRKLLR